jgi:hypothetical protein
MARSRVRESDAEIAAQIKVAITKQERRQLKRAVKAQANEMKAFAQSISPVDTGQYVDSFKVDEFDRDDGLPGATLKNTDKIANLVEYGSIHNDEYAVLARTAHEFGGTVDHE